MEEIGVHRENQRPAESHWQTKTHNWLIETNWIGRCKSNHRMITSRTSPGSASVKYRELKTAINIPCRLSLQIIDFYIKCYDIIKVIIKF